MKIPRTIDSHTHILTQEAMRLLAKESPKVAPVLKNTDASNATLEINGKIVQQPLPREIWDVGFMVGSVVAAFMQGAMVGALAQGLPIAD